MRWMTWRAISTRPYQVARRQENTALSHLASAKVAMGKKYTAMVDEMTAKVAHVKQFAADAEDERLAGGILRTTSRPMLNLLVLLHISV